MIMHVLVRKSPYCDPGPPACAVFLDREEAAAIAEDPWEAAGWCTTADFFVQSVKIIGIYTPGKPVFAAHQAMDSGEGYRFISLYSTFEAAEVAAGNLGAVIELFPDYRPQY
jgi:hypothetical protein